ncbi:hypothetical protein NLI96_g8907 [Meripilus lineatus]|uniref:BolA-like protein n=1 Tax=Meripilus lineatus TaxID=2056292 RepID=A0AAD5V1P9_9APHY|nr:hypothetical protein NLI96_g8907 [Physisporinus lineatus]
MPVSLNDLENAIRTALPISHLEIIDASSGCGENYAVVVVSEVRAQSSNYDLIDIEGGFEYQAFEGKSTLARHRYSESSLLRPAFVRLTRP